MIVDGDVAVVGVGSVGSMALWRLAKRGVAVHGFEQLWTSHDQSAAGGETRMFRSTSPRESLYVEIAASSRILWEELQQDSGYGLLFLNGELAIGPESDQFMKNTLESIETYSLKHELLEARDLEERFPQHRLMPDDIGILDPNAGFIRSELGVLAATRRAIELGATVHSYCRVERIEADGDGVEIVTSERKFRFHQVVVAGGPWTSHLFPRWKSKIEVKRPIQAWFAVDDPKAFSASGFPNVLRPDEGGYYGFPTLDDATIKIGLTGAYKETVSDADHLDRTVRPSEVRLFSETVRKFLRGVHPDPVRVAAYMEGYTVDNRPLAGHPKGMNNVLMLGGFSGLGFKYAPAFGDAAADVVIEGETSLDLSPFEPNRELADWGRREE